MIPSLSVAIPTHNRSEYAIHAIKALLAIPDPRIEIVVSDTSSDGLLSAALETRHPEFLRDSRLKYFRPERTLDMTGNHNEAIDATTGEYICLIGDDDVITHEAVSAAVWAKKHDVDVIAPDVVANYAWPDFKTKFFGSGHASRLYFANSFSGWRWVDSTHALSRSLANGGQGTDGLPKIYHGIVRRTALSRLQEKAGNYFHGSSPDVSGAVGLACITGRFLAVRYPLTIPGASGGSNTGRSALNQHKGRLSGEAQTRSYVNAGWSGGVPRFFSVETVWAHAALATINRLSPDRQVDYNYAKLIAVCKTLHGEYQSEIEVAAAEACSILGISRQELSLRARQEKLHFFIERYKNIFNRMLRPTAAGGRRYVDGLQTIAEAPMQVENELRRRNQSWGQFASTIVF